MKSIIVDDELLMIRSFCRVCKDIPDIEIEEKFEYPDEVCDYVKENPIDIAFLDIEMPEINGIQLAGMLREIQPDIMIVFITAYDHYIQQANELAADYYIVKPYKKETIEKICKKLSYLHRGQKNNFDHNASNNNRLAKKDVFIHTFGRFGVFVNGKQIPLVGKTKEILALVVSRRGKEISNEEIYTTIWEDRPYDNVHMKVYYNALRRLRDNLEKEGLENILISTSRGQMANVDAFECDYYAWLEKDDSVKYRFDGEFLSEYSWSEEMLAEMIESPIHLYK